jgi:hypothetical protein
VLDLKERFKILYWVTPSKPILYAFKNKKATIVENFDFIPRNTAYCAVLPSQKIVPFKFQTLFSSSQNIMVAENHDESEFYVADENFRTIAYGKVSTKEFNTYKNHICEAYNLKGPQKWFLMINYYATIPIQKYLKCISPLLTFWTNFFHRELPYLNKCANDINKKNCLSKIFLLIFHVSPVYFVMSSVTFYTVMFPFHILALPIYLFLFEFNFTSFCVFPVALFFANS